jgi:RND family efflux transporter MFP subunit
MKKCLLLPLILVVAAGCGERESDSIDSVMKEGLFADSIPVETLALRSQEFVETFDAAGIIEAEEDVTVSAEISGRIVEIHRELGDVVDAGDWLVSLDKSAINARIRKIEAQLARANTQLEWSRRDLERQQDLFEQEIAAERAYDEAQRLVDTSRDDMAAAEADLELARVDLARSTIRSPIRGRIAKRHVATGEYVREGTQIFDVVGTERVKFVFSVAERDVIAISENDMLSVRIDAYTPDSFDGIVRAISPAGNQLTRTFRIEVEILNSEHRPILPAMSGRTTVVRRRFANVYLLPEEAVLRDEEGSYVYLANDDHAKRVPIEIISQIGDKVVVPASTAVFNSIDPERTAAAYEQIKPLIEDVFADLGYPRKAVEPSIERAFTNALAMDDRWDVIILGQSAVSPGTEVRIRQRHETIPQSTFD